MDYIVVTVRTQAASRDLELPADIPTGELADKLATIFKLSKKTTSGSPVLYKLLTLPARHSLNRNETLANSGIVTGRVLSLLPIDAGTAVLQTSSGRAFTLDRPEKQLYTIGRGDGSQTPDIDLGQEPLGDTVSRMHAQLYQQAGRWHLVQVASSNVTRIDGTQLTPNQPYPLRSGAKLTFGDLDCTFLTT